MPSTHHRTSTPDSPRRRLVALAIAAAAAAAASGLAASPTAAAPSAPPDPSARSLRGTIAFVCEHDDGANDELCLMDADGARRTRITTNDGPDRAPTWSPDGRQLVFNSRRDPHPTQPQIYVYDLATATATRASNGPVEDQRASWTPDGRSIVFQRGTFAAGYELYRQRLSDGALTQLTNDPGKINAAGSFAPDGTRLVLQSNRDVAGLFPFGTYVVDRVSGTTTRIASEVAASHDGPRWSPDGRSIAFAAGGDLYVVDLAEGTVDAVTDGPDSDSSPAWSPDGTKLVFQSVPPEPVDADEDHVDVTEIEVLDLASGTRTFLGEGRTPVWTRAVRSPDYGRLPSAAAERTHAGLVHRTFLLALDRPADPAGLAFWTGRLQRGTSPQRLAASVVGSSEHRARFGDLDATAFVERLYTHGLRRDPDPHGLAFWVGRIERGQSTRAQVLGQLARSNELITRIATAPR